MFRRRMMMTSSVNDGEESGGEITFYVIDENETVFTYSAEEGMTWHEFMMSDRNKYVEIKDIFGDVFKTLPMFATNSDGEINTTDEFVFFMFRPDDGEYISIHDGNFTEWYSPSDKIIANKHYYAI